MSGGKAPTPNESDEDEHQDIRDEMQIEPEDNEPEDNGSPLPQPQNEDNDRPQIWQAESSGCSLKVYPPEMIAKLSCAFKKQTPGLLWMFAVIMQCLLGSNQTEFCMTCYGLVQNEQQLQSQDQSSKYIPLQPGITFWRQLLMN